jgi:ATP-binding cassette subfamily B protein/subfamily B ATP-binding cassette protein MsbA
MSFIVQSILERKRLCALVVVLSLFAGLFEGTSYAFMLAGLAALTSPEAIAPTIDKVGAHVPMVKDLAAGLSGRQLFMLLIGLAAGAQLVRASMTYIGLASASTMAAQVSRKIRMQVQERVLKLSFSISSSFKAGDLVDRATRPAWVAVNWVLLANQVLVAVIVGLTYVALLMTISVKMTLLAVCLFGPVLALQRGLVHRIRTTADKMNVHLSDFTVRLVENLSALRVIHTFGMSEESLAKVKSGLDRLYRGERRQLMLTTAVHPLSETTMILALSGFLVLTVGLGTVIGTDIYMPELLTIITLLYRLSSRVQVANNALASMSSYVGQIRILDELFEEKARPLVRQGGVEVKALDRGVAFSKVRLRYDGAESDAVSGLDFELPKGKMVALVGASGAGKSTVADLLLGLFDPSEGAVLVDGRDLRQVSLRSWRRLVGTVSQDTMIFHDTVASNIAFGNPAATKEEIERAARVAHAHEFIMGLPDGYETILGDRGYRLSGGQRQRLALARAIVRQPQLLILDEATSALDSESERLIKTALEEFQKHRTVLVIAHRLSTIVNADLIVVMERGRVMEQGTHEELIARGGKYAEYWKLQAIV